MAERLFDRDVQLTDDFVVMVDGEAVAILNPSLVLGEAGDGLAAIVGPNGLVSLELGASPADRRAALAAAGCLLFGSPPEVLAVRALLADPDWSRTAAYLCATAEDCAAILATVAAVRAARVVIIGCGGIGSLAAALLGGLGVAHLTLVDGDLIEASNFNRQLFWRLDDIGRPKVDALADYLYARHPSLDVATRVERLEPSQISAVSAGADVVLLCADEPLAMNAEIARLGRESPSMICINAGYSFIRGIVRRHPAGRRVRRDPRNWSTLRGGIMPSYGPLNAEVAGRAVGEIVKALSGRAELERRATVWAP